MEVRAGDSFDPLLRHLEQNPVTGLGIGLVLLAALYKLLVGRLGTNKQRHTAATSPTSAKKAGHEAEDASPKIEPLENFDWRTTEPTKHLPIKPVYHITMALQQDTPSNLITIDKDYLDRVTLRRNLIEQLGAGVHDYLPRGRTAVNELYTYLMRDYLPVRYPSMFKQSLDGYNFENVVTGKAFPICPPEDPTVALRTIGETVEEDIFLLQETPDGHLCVAFMCCFPSGFDPSKKFGNLLKDIHGPVPSYEKIGSSMERVFTKLQVGKSVKRLNWSFQTNGDMYTQGNHITDDSADETTDQAIDMDQTYFRVELQTLTRLPKTHTVMFSFKTYMYAVRQIKEDGNGPELADAIEGLKTGNAPGMWRYKAAVRWGKPVCDYLRS